MAGHHFGDEFFRGLDLRLRRQLEVLDEPGGSAAPDRAWRRCSDQVRRARTARWAVWPLCDGRTGRRLFGFGTWLHERSEIDRGLCTRECGDMAETSRLA